MDSTVNICSYKIGTAWQAVLESLWQSWKRWFDYDDGTIHEKKNDKDYDDDKKNVLLGLMRTPSYADTMLFQFLSQLVHASGPKQSKTISEEARI